MAYALTLGRGWPCGTEFLDAKICRTKKKMRKLADGSWDFMICLRIGSAFSLQAFPSLETSVTRLARALLV